MTHVYLAKWVWDTDDTGGFWTSPGGDHIGCIDLRTLKQMGSPGTINGYGIFCYKTTKTIRDAIYLGLDVNAELDFKQRENLKSILNLPEIPSGKLTDIIWDILGKYSDPTGKTGPKTIMPDSKLDMDLYLGGFSKIKSEKFDINTHPLKDKVLGVIKNDYKITHGDGRPKVTRQKVMGALLKKFKVSDHTIFLPEGFPDEGWKEPNTTFADSFNRADNTDLNDSDTGKLKNGSAGTWQWNEVDADHEIESNTIQNVGTDVAYSRCDDDLSSADQTCDGLTKIVNIEQNSAKQWGPCARFSASANTSYMFMRQFRNSTTASSTVFIILRKTVTGSRTNIGTSQELDVNVDEVIQTEINGSTLRGLLDEFVRDTITDTAITGNLRTGIYSVSSASAGHIAMDDWASADIVAAGAADHIVISGDSFVQFTTPVTV